jgi:hypothetical protein
MQTKLTIGEFLEKLQKEYVSAEIRSKIYVKTSDKNYWERVMYGKQEKIENISTRNNLATIFDSPEVKKRVYQEVIGDSGLPSFSYKNDEERYGTESWSGMEERDFFCYYFPGAEVRVGDRVNYRIGKIVSASLEQKIVNVKIGGQEEIFPFGLVTRII